jgi:Telomeric single stranded DNA binding POT1/CDC13
METLTLLDGSLQGQGTVDITVFGTDAENLPRVRQVGDIVRLHRVKVRCDRREAREEATPRAPASWLGTAGHAKNDGHTQGCVC